MATTRIIKRTAPPKYKSKLEKELAALLGPSAKYETTELSFVKNHKYYPDFTMSDTVYIEGKGYFDSEDRAKHLLIKEQHPDKTIRFVFYNSKNKIHRQSKTTYADWCEKHGFQYCDIKDGIPKDWSVNNESFNDSADTRGKRKVRGRAKPARD